MFLSPGFGFFAGAGGVPTSLAPIDASATAVGGLAVTSSISWGSDGSITASGVAGGAWYLSPVAGIGANFWIRVNKVSGDTPTGLTLGVWLPLSSSRMATLATNGGNSVRACSLTVEISPDAGASIAGTGVASIYAESAA